MSHDAAFDARLEGYRLAFDRSFAEPPPDAARDPVKMLAVRVGADALAVRLDELAGLHPRRAVALLPGAAADLLGLASIRGKLVPVYHLAALLGHGAAAADWRWLVLAAGPAPVALAFHVLDGYLQAPPDALCPLPATDRRGSHVRELVRAGGVVRGVVSVASLVTSIGQRVGCPSAAKEL